jgi:hypothetical protein
MKRLMLLRLSERTGYSLDVICTGCGLQLPRQPSATAHPEPACGYFESCPHCGGGRFVWCPLPHYDAPHYPWMDLPGYLGEEPGTREPPEVSQARAWTEASEVVVQRLARLWPLLAVEDTR